MAYVLRRIGTRHGTVPLAAGAEDADLKEDLWRVIILDANDFLIHGSSEKCSL